jgi:HK97 family phage portal protein
VLVFEGREERIGHPISRLLERPNPWDTGAGLLEALYGHMLVSGNGYLEAVGTEERIAELYALRPDRMKVVPGADGRPDAYDYTVGGKTVRFDQRGEGVTPILHLSLFHPLDDHYGLSPMEAAAASIDVHNAAAAWNKALLDNAARPSGALIHQGPPGTTLTAEQFERLKAELETSFQGTGNAGRPLLLEGGLDWKPLSLSPKDMDFMEAKAAAAREIALAFGVPPMLLGLPGDNTFANYAEANRTFWRQTVLPLAQRTLKSLEQWLAPAFGEVALALDLDGAEALSSEREALWARVGNAAFLTEDEKREAVGYGPRGGSGR